MSFRFKDCTKKVEAGFLSGDEAATTETLSILRVPSLSVCRRYLCNQDDAEDAFQNACINAWRFKSYFRGDCSFTSWWFRVLLNEIKQVLRKRHQRDNELLAGDLYDLTLSEHESIKRDIKKMMDPPQIEALEHRERWALVKNTKWPDNIDPRPLYLVLGGYHNNEIAALLGLTIPAAKSRRHRAKLFLLRRLKQLDENERLSAELRRPLAA